MPKRSNEFQRLVKLVQQALAPQGATVHESAMVENQGNMREIDVLVEGAFGSYQMKIAVEVKDESRPLGPGQVEEYIGKYRQGDGIKVNHVVIVSKKGFTRGAKDKARTAGITLLKLSEATTADWQKFVKPGTTQTLRFGMEPHFHEILFDPPIEADPKRAISLGTVECKCCGKNNGNLLRFIEKRIQQRLTREPDLQKKIREEMIGRGGNVLVGFPLCGHNKSLLLDNRRWPLGIITAHVHFCEAEGPMNFQLYEQEDAEGNIRTIQRAQACVGGKKFDLILPDGIESRKIVLDISDDHTCD